MKININQDKVEKLAFKDIPVNTMFIYSDDLGYNSSSQDKAFHIKISDVEAVRVDPKHGTTTRVNFHQTNRWYFFKINSIDEISVSLILPVS